MATTQRWAEEEFGGAALGDARRSRRLVALAAEVGRTPAGTVTRACSSSASREGAFRLLENPAVRPDAIRERVHAAAVERCNGRPITFVPVDATSLNITDRKQSKGLGGVGAWRQRARGVLVMTALAVGEEGAPLGIVGQEMHVREERAKPRRRNVPQYSADGRRWIEMLHTCRERFMQSDRPTTPWFQIDRGGDCWQVLCYAANADVLLTVRATHDRLVDGDLERLWATLERAPVIATKRVEVAARPEIRRPNNSNRKFRFNYLDPARPPRTAKVAIRAACVPLRVRTPDDSRVVHLNAILVRERHASKPIEWLLLTTHPIATKADVLKVVAGYCYRWRIEDFHRAWKRGLCRVEDTQLRSRDAIFKWATILAAVATRALRLTHLARETPDVSASTEFTKLELEAIIALRDPKNLGDTPPTLERAVRWLAEIGGYTGPWNGPPGPTVIGRGLHDVLIAARAFANRKK
jgi:hypothetical protein